MEAFTAAETAFLERQRLGRIATASPTGEPDVAPVTFRLHDGAIEVGGLDNPRTIKYRNVVANGRAAFVVDDLRSVDPWAPQGVKVRGSAEVVDRDGRPTLRISPEVVWSWGINVGAATHFANVEKRVLAPPSAADPA